MTLWGTGTPRREFLHVDDLADAVLHLLRTLRLGRDDQRGHGEDVTIRELAELDRRASSATPARPLWDTSKPDGTPRKLLDVSRLQRLGWSPSVESPSRGYHNLRVVPVGPLCLITTPGQGNGRN